MTSNEQKGFGSIDTFKSNIKGITQGNRYKVSFSTDFVFGQCGFPNGSYHFLIKDVNMPGQTLTLASTIYFGSKLQIAASMDMDKLNLTVICDNKMRIRKAFEMWMKKAFDKPSWTCGFLHDYSCNTIIDVYNKKLERIKSVIVQGTYPSELGDLSLSYESNDTVLEFSVGMPYYNWFDSEVDMTTQSGLTINSNPFITNYK